MNCWNVFTPGKPFDGAQLALDLGYADQAHLIHDFRKLAGFTPTEYLRRSDSYLRKANIFGGNVASETSSDAANFEA